MLILFIIFYFILCWSNIDWAFLFLMSFMGLSDDFKALYLLNTIRNRIFNLLLHIWYRIIGYLIISFIRVWLFTVFDFRNRKKNTLSKLIERLESIGFNSKKIFIHDFIMKFYLATHKSFFEMMIEVIAYDICTNLPFICNQVNKILQKLGMAYLANPHMIQHELPIALHQLLILL